MYKVSSGTLNLYSSLRDSQTFASPKAVQLSDSQIFVTVKNCRVGSTAKHIQYKYYARYARDLTMGYARRPTAYRAAPGIIRVKVFSVGQGGPAFLRLYFQPPLYETLKLGVLM